jgi:hypothetical protein
MKRLIAKSVIALAAATGLTSMVPSVAKADTFHVGARFDREPQRRWVEPVYEERVTQVWCEPVYETRYVPHWVKPYYKTVTDRVWVEPIHEWRDVVSYDRRGHRIVRRAKVCVREGGWKTIERQEYVPGHTKHEPEQVLVHAGHYQTKRERVCVREGYWETVPVNHRHDHDRRDRYSVGFGFGGLFK